MAVEKEENNSIENTVLKKVLQLSDMMFCIETTHIVSKYVPGLYYSICYIFDTFNVYLGRARRW